MEYCTIIKGNKVPIHAATWMNPENAPSERSQSQATTYFIIPFIENVQNRKSWRDGK